jgi:hypothetical protein
MKTDVKILGSSRERCPWNLSEKHLQYICDVYHKRLSQLEDLISLWGILGWKWENC